MLCKLAWGNVRRSGRDYLVYLLTLTLAVTVFYAFNTVSMQVDIAGIKSHGMSQLLAELLGGLTVFLAVVMGFLMVYANNFIMRRRKREFGLYQVLGMGRGQVARVMALETLMVSVTALVLGLVLGIGLSQLMTFFTASLFKTQIADFHFFVSGSALLVTVGCLLAIFLVTLAFNLRVVSRSRIADLMGAGRANEAVRVRNPWLSAVLFVIGAALVGVAYHRLLRDGLPLEESGTPAFAVTTAMVVIGTLLLFFGLSGFVLKVLQSLRGLYWRGLNMYTLRQLSAKVNTVSVSMAIVSMILFLAITSVTGGMSIANMLNENAERNTPADCTRTLMYYSPSTNSYASAWATGDGTETASTSEPVDVIRQLRDTVTVGSADEDAEGYDASLLERAGAAKGQPYDLSTIAGKTVQVNVYDSTPEGADKPLVSFPDVSRLVGAELPKGVSSNANLGLGLISESNYNEYLRFRGHDPIDLGDDGYLVTCSTGASLANVYNKLLSGGHELTLGSVTLRPAADKVDEALSVFSNGGADNGGSIVVPDRVIDELGLSLSQSSLLLDYRPGLDVEVADAYVNSGNAYGAPVTDDAGRSLAFWGMSATKTSTYEGIDSMNGLISYLAIYIGFVLVVACAAILTIQQLSSVADAGRSHRTLSELGCPESQVCHSVLVQQTVFFLFPLAVGIAHSLVALRVVIDLVELFGGLSIGGMVGMTCVIFALAYGGYFLVTYVMSRGIVHDAVRAGRGR